MATTAERFWSKVNKTESCWLWTAGLHSTGYGWFWVGGGRSTRAHGWAFEDAIGPVPVGMDLDHTCRVRRCVNPSHLQPVTRSQNMQNRTGPNRSSTTGVRGVTYDKECGRYLVQVVVGGRHYKGGRFAALSEAEKVAIDLRNKLMTNNLLDRHPTSGGAARPVS